MQSQEQRRGKKYHIHHIVIGRHDVQQHKRNSQRDDHDVQQPKQICEPQFKTVVSTIRKQQAGLQREEGGDDMGHPIVDSKS